MSVSDVQSDDCAGSADLPLARAQKLLEEVLQIIDQHAARPDLSARVQEVIDSLQSPTD
jgi:hypothetical protein